MEPTGECKWLGDVTGSQGDSFTGQYTTNANLESGATIHRTGVTLTGSVYRCPLEGS